VWLELLLRRVQVLPTAARGPLALGIAWALVGSAIGAEPVLARLAPYAPGAALALACLAQREALARAPCTLRATAQLGMLWLLTLLEQPLLALWVAPVLGPVVRELRGIEGVSELTRRAALASDAPKPATSLAQAAALSYMLVGAVALHEASRAVGAIRSEGFDALREALLEDARPRTLLLLHADIAESLARSGHSARVRPDMQSVNGGALIDPQQGERVAAQHPKLKALVRASLLRGVIDPVELQTLGTTRRVKLTPDALGFVSVRETLLPSALGFDTTTNTAMSADLKAGWASAEPGSTRLFAELDPLQLDPSTRAFLREQCALTAALLAGLERGAVLAQHVDLASLYAVGAAERAQLREVLSIVGIPAAAIANPRASN
jgi:hypothetical protein